MVRLLGAVVWGVWLALSAGGACAAEHELKRFQSTQVEMGVPFRILLYAADEGTAKGAMEAAFARIAELNSVLSDYDRQSELSRLSNAAPTAEPIPLGDDLWHVLERSQALAARTGGAFDVTVGPYVRLWRRARRQKEMPSPERLAAARAAVGFEKLLLDCKNRSARLTAPDMRLDLGGIAMGYAVDEALAVLREHGITRALIDASGDIGASDPPPGDAGWTVSVIPLSEDGGPTRRVLLANAAITTSGDAFQHVVIDGQRYSHIVDPRSGLGLTSQTSVTVIARDCITADSLATAASVLGPEGGLALIEETPGAAGFIVRNQNGVIDTIATPSFKKYLAPEQTPR